MYNPHPPSYPRVRSVLSILKEIQHFPFLKPLEKHVATSTTQVEMNKILKSFLAIKPLNVL